MGIDIGTMVDAQLGKFLVPLFASKEKGGFTILNY